MREARVDFFKKLHSQGRPLGFVMLLPFLLSLSFTLLRVEHFLTKALARLGDATWGGGDDVLRHILTFL